MGLPILDLRGVSKIVREIEFEWGFTNLSFERVGKRINPKRRAKKEGLKKVLNIRKTSFPKFNRKGQKLFLGLTVILTKKGFIA